MKRPRLHQRRQRTSRFISLPFQSILLHDVEQWSSDRILQTLPQPPSAIRLCVVRPVDEPGRPIAHPSRSVLSVLMRMALKSTGTLAAQSVLLFCIFHFFYLVSKFLSFSLFHLAAKNNAEAACVQA